MSSRTVTTIAGTAGNIGFSDGTGAAARLGRPTAIILTSNGEIAFIVSHLTSV